MKKMTITFCMGIVVLTACNDGTTETAENKIAASIDSAPAIVVENAKEAWVAVDSATEMKAWMEYATPGEPQKMLMKSAGNWTGETTMWMKKDAPPVTSKANAVYKSELGGRFLSSYFSGEMMGMPFEGKGTTGYDNYKKKYVSTWTDNMGTGVMVMEGTWDEATKSVTYTGSMTSPANGKECKMKEIYTIIDDNNEKMEMYGPDSKTGEQYKTMEIKLTRKK